MSHANKLTVIPPEVVEKVQKSGLGLLTTWAPQRQVLQHPAIGYFLTHAGFNGVLEALTEGVPM